MLTSKNVSWPHFSWEPGPPCTFIGPLYGRCPGLPAEEATHCCGRAQETYTQAIVASAVATEGAGSRGGAFPRNLEGQPPVPE